jgi:hypothetical protein
VNILNQGNKTIFVVLQQKVGYLLHRNDKQNK